MTELEAKKAALKARHEQEVAKIEAEHKLTHAILEALDVLPTTVSLTGNYIPDSASFRNAAPLFVRDIYLDALEKGLIVPFTYGRCKSYTHSMPEECLEGVHELVERQFADRYVRLICGTSGYTRLEFYVRIEGKVVKLSFDLFTLLKGRQNALTWKVYNASVGRGGSNWQYSCPPLLQNYWHSFTHREKGQCDANFILSKEQVEGLFEKLLPLEGGV